jgi:uncharacterized protein
MRGSPETSSVVAMLRTLLLSMIALRLTSPARADAPPQSEVMKLLFATTNDGFTPPQDNRPLQAVLAKKPTLTFFEACAVGDVAQMTRELARDGKLATAWNDFGWSALHLAAFSGVPEAVRLLLDRGADIHARAKTRFRNTPLQTALLPGQLATTKLLLERGADPLVRQARGFTPMHEAALLGRRDLVDVLLAAGAELDSRADDGRTPLSEARRRKRDDLVRYLAGKGAHGPELAADLAAPPKE